MLTFVTTNAGKVAEAREYLDEDVQQQAFDYPEVQADDLATVAAAGARAAYREVGRPVVIDDSGLVIDAFDGFPGPYSSFVEDTLGIERVWELAKQEDDRSAAFRAVVAYCDGGSVVASDPVDGRADASGDPPVKLFEGEVRGTLVTPRGDGGFGFDPIFEYEGETFAEMGVEAKNEISHRGRALASFAEWYAKR